MTNKEVVDRLSDAIRNVQMVIDPEDKVTIFCEDPGYEQQGKYYIFYLTMPLAYYKMGMEGINPQPAEPS